MRENRRMRKAAEKRIAQKVGFYWHAVIFGGMSFLVIAINFLHFISKGTGLSDYFPIAILLLMWGICVGFHYAAVFGIPGTNILTEEWRETEFQKELDTIDLLPFKKHSSENTFFRYFALKSSHSINNTPSF